MKLKEILTSEVVAIPSPSILELQKGEFMRLSAFLMVAMMVAGPVAFAGGKSEAKKFHKMCREENPGASKADLKKCVKEKIKEAKSK